MSAIIPVGGRTHGFAARLVQVQLDQAPRQANGIADFDCATDAGGLYDARKFTVEISYKYHRPARR